MKVKKSKKANLENKRFIFFQMGLIIVLSATLYAFEWNKPMDKNVDLLADNRMVEMEEMIDITVQKQKKPELPKPDVIKPIEIVDDDTEIEDDIEISSEVTDETENDPNTFVPDEPDDDPDEDPIVTIVEHMPEFPGGYTEMYKFLGANMKYPTRAREAGIEGTVHVSFVVWNDGSIRNTSILRGIGGGCDEEAIRVVNLMPKWKPGIQLTKKVNVQMSLPVKFVLNK